MKKPHQKIKVLFVEDNDADVLLLREFFDRKGRCEIQFVEDGEVAIEYLAGTGNKNPVPDLIIMDLNMPKVDGREVLRTIRHDPRTKHVPVIIMTSSSDHEDILTSYEHCANCYLSKPADLDGLLNLLDLVERFWIETACLPRPREKAF